MNSAGGGFNPPPHFLHNKEAEEAEQETENKSWQNIIFNNQVNFGYLAHNSQNGNNVMQGNHISQCSADSL